MLCCAVPVAGDSRAQMALQQVGVSWAVDRAQCWEVGFFISLLPFWILGSERKVCAVAILKVHVVKGKKKKKTKRISKNAEQKLLQC